MRIERNETLIPMEVNELLATNHWDVKQIEKLEKILTNSWGWVTARDDSGTLIGFVHIISDGVRHALIARMIVHPDFRNQGIGTQIMNEVLKMLGENKLLPVLTANPGKTGFYKKFGFETESAGYTAMCIKKPFWNE
jgi:ribosomal protein S18 acetylase RimI-like enzyme